MKRLNRFFAILFAMLGVSSLSAQTWTPSNVAAGTYYIYNVGAKKFMCSGNNWGSHASVTEGGIPLTLAGSGNVYTISTADIYKDKYLNEVWMDGGSYDWTFEAVGDGVYKIKNGSNVLYWNGGTSTNTTLGTDPGTEAAQWMLVTEENRVAAMASATEGNPVDATFLIKNAYFAKGNGMYFEKGSDLANSNSWKGTSMTDFWGIDKDGEDACYAVEQYGKVFDNYQELTVPNGKYFMTAKGFYRGNVVPYIYANSAKCNLKQKGDIGGDNIGNGAKAMLGDAYLLDGVNVVVTDGTLRVGIKSDASIDWCVFDDFKLVYYGKDLTTYENALRTAITNANSIDQSQLNTIVKTQLNNAIANAEATLNDANRTVESLEQQVGLLNAAIKLANAIAAQMPTANALVATCESYLDNSTPKQASSKTTFETAIVQAESEVNGATTAEALTKAINDLEAARQVYVVSATPNGVTFDLNFKMTNNWINGGNTYNAGDVTMRERYFEDVYRTGDMMTQTISGLANGIYNVELYANANWTPNRGNIQTAAADAGAEVSSVFANEITAKVPLAHQTATATAGQYKLEGVEVKNGTINLGIRNDANGANWILIAPKSLTFVSALDLSELIATLTNDLERANAINGKMSTAAQQQLAAAIEGVDVNSDNPDELDRMITDLQAAITAAETSISDYAKIKTYIEKANKIDESIAASYQTQYNEGTVEGSAEDVFQALEVATYNYVTSNFTYDVALSDTWNSTGTNTRAATFSDEHWSGEAREYKNQYDDWGDNKQGYPANSWSIDFDQDVTLPAGEYVFKVAGRKSVDATLELVVTKGETTLGTVNDFPSSNNSLGINKAGAASFDAEDPAGFANNGNGCGWQWRYVKFTLEEESTVKVAIHAETDMIYNWVSFGDYTLQMTEETYMAAGQPELDAALDAAQELVGTKPMGTAEETALNEAINLPVTTGAEQKAKVNALNTAVANANAWRTTYYAEKDALVAALERFEADYNDAENGSLDDMNKNRWTTVIAKAQAAAVAKDNQTSYEEMETAADELIAALDAATVSIGEYKNLKSAIDEANALVAANVGDQPFERPQSAADALGTTEDEQAVYDAATADGEDVTSLTTALNEGIATFKAVPLNAPKEGARYNLVMTYKYWEHDGKAVTYLANDRADAGLYNIKYYTVPNANYAQAFTLTAVEGKQDCYYLSMTDVDGNERYVCTGVAYGGNTGQIRTTTNVADALAVKVIATTTDGVHNLYNTEAENYIGGQDAGFFTVNSHTTFNIVEAKKANVTLSISAAKWSTLILPFDAELPEGVKAYSCDAADVEAETLTLTEATTLKANTPYLINGEADSHEFSGYGLADKDAYTVGLFTGTYVDYQTVANNGTYVLQKQDNVLAFYLVSDSAQPWVRAYRCYITLDNASAARMFSFGFDDETTGINDAQWSTGDSELTIYDTMGRKVTSMKKGNLYIINGKKVIVK